MTGKKAGAGSNKPKTIVADHPDDRKGALKRIGGSRSDTWNNILANQTVQTLWLKDFSKEARGRQYRATVAALIGIGPKHELEGMIAAQLLAAHNAAMECYRRAMIGEQTFEGRSENLSQANKLSRTYAVLLEALNRHRGKGQQKVTVEHVHVHPGGQVIVAAVSPGGRDKQKSEEQGDSERRITHEPGTPLRSPDPEREPVPVAWGCSTTFLVPRPPPFLGTPARALYSRSHLSEAWFS
jgi:hypothetical protein